MGPENGTVAAGNGTVLTPPDTWTPGEIVEVTYTSATFLLGLFGNLFVVITSHLYHSIDLDAVTIVFVRQLAIADLLLILNTVLPTIITMFSGKWILGDLVCDITGHFNFIPVMVNIYLVMNLSIFKILACKMPFRMRDVTTKHAWLLVLLAYLLASVEFFESIFLARSGMFAPPVSRCLSKIYVTNRTLMLWNAAIPVGLPILVIVFCNVWIYMVARKVVQARGQGSHSRALLTICAVSGLFVLSWAPKLIYVTVVTITKQQIPWAVKISHFFPFVNSVGNPFIYTFTNKRYGEFVYNLFVKFKITAKETSSDVMSKIQSEIKSSKAALSPRPVAKYHKVLGEDATPIREEQIPKSAETTGTTLAPTALVVPKSQGKPTEKPTLGKADERGRQGDRERLQDEVRLLLDNADGEAGEREEDRVQEKTEELQEKVRLLVNGADLEEIVVNTDGDGAQQTEEPHFYIVGSNTDSS